MWISFGAVGTLRAEGFLGSEEGEASAASQILGAGGTRGLGKFRSRRIKDISTRVGPATEFFFNSAHRGKPSGSYCFCSGPSCVWFRCTAGVAAETAAV